jgi:type IV secretion system protein VirB4
MLERLVSEYVRWADYGADDLIILKGRRGVFMMIEVDGLPFETVDLHRIVRQHRDWEQTLRNVGQDGMTFYSLQCRGICDPAIYPEGRFRTEFSEALDRHYQERLFARGMWLNRSYLAVQLMPRQYGLVAGVRRWLPGGQANAENSTGLIARLRAAVGLLREELRDYSPRILGVKERDGALFSEAAEAVSFAMTGYWRPVPLTVSGPGAMFSEEFHIGHEAFEIRHPHGSTFGACLDMQDYPYRPKPMMFDRFLSADYRHTVHHSFRCLPPLDGEILLTRKQNRGRQAGDRALSQLSELTEAAAMVAAGQMIMGEHAMAVTVFTDAEDKISEVVRKATSDLARGGTKVERSNLALEGVLFSMIPGNFDLRGREAGVSSRNFCAFAPMHNFPRGDARGHWGDPLCLFRTSGGTPYLYHPVYDGVGNGLISGETGSGKSVGLGFLVSQAERAGAQVVLWDKDRGLEALVHALDGSYLRLVNRPGEGSGVAPLKRLTDSPDDLAFLSGLVRACIATPQPYDLTPEEDRRLAIALRYVMRAPPEDRSMAEVRGFLGTSRDGAGARLEKWCWGNEFGWIIDGPRDIVNLNAGVIGFDQSKILDDPIASGAIIASLFHYTGSLVDGRRLLFLLDEVWRALQIPQFLGVINNGLKTWRKYNSPVIVATQDVSDALNSPIGDTIRTQTPNQIYYSNPGAHWRHYGPDGMNLTETEFDIIKKLPKGRGFFLLKQGGRSVVLQCPLDGLDEVRVISGTRTGSDAIDLARERTGNATGMEFVAAYHGALEEMAQ